MGKGEGSEDGRSWMRSGGGWMLPTGASARVRGWAGEKGTRVQGERPQNLLPSLHPSATGGHPSRQH